MASLKAIRRRISSVRSTQQITRAMKLVAAARLRRAQEALQNASPYHQALVRVADSLFATEQAALGPAEDAKREALIVVIGSDRGLCGGYNANIMRAAEDEARRAERDGIEGQVLRRRAQGARPSAPRRTRDRPSADQQPAPGHLRTRRRTLPRACWPTFARAASARPGSSTASSTRRSRNGRPTSGCCR